MNKKRTNHSRRLLLILLSALLAIAIAACGNGKTTEKSDGGVTTGQKNTQEKDKPASANEEGEAKKGSGIYVGQADTHTVEITVNGEATAFQLGEGTQSVIEKLQKDDKVEFEYTEKAIEGDDSIKQLILSKITKVE